jgi:hypothetical protein
MRALMSLASIVVVLGIGYWIYTTNFKANRAVAAPEQTISVVGVKSDLLSMAQAERMYQATHGSYASLDDLYSSGALTVLKSGRVGYSYSADVSSDSFMITARCQPQGSAPCPSFSIDQTMQVQQLP